MAGFEPAALIVEIMNEDGTMARRPQLEEFAREARPAHGHHRRPDRVPRPARAIRGIAQLKTVLTEFGEFELHTFLDLIDDTVHYALTRGDISEDRKPWYGCRRSMHCATYWARVLKVPIPAGPIAAPWSTSPPKVTAQWSDWPGHERGTEPGGSLQFPEPPSVTGPTSSAGYRTTG